MTLLEQVNDNLKSAMKAKDKVALQTLRNIKKLFLEAQTKPGADHNVSDDEALKIIQKLVKQGKDSAAIYAEQNRQDLADEELAQVEILEGYLPKQLSDEELTKEIECIIAKAGATSMKDMGKVMGIATSELAGKAEGKAISDKVRKMLA